MTKHKKECPSCAMEVDRHVDVCPICQYEFADTNRNQKKVFVIVLILLLLFIVIYVLN